MLEKPTEADSLFRPSNEMRDTIIKSGLSGVAATVLAVTIWSPAGLGGMIGTSMASAADGSSAADTLGNLAPYPVPITEVELADIRARLSASAASLDELRAATDDNIDHMRRLAANQGSFSVAPMAEVAQVGAGMVVTHQTAAAGELWEPANVATAEPSASAVIPVEVRYDAAPAQLKGTQPVTLSAGDHYDAPRDPNMELAALLFAL